MMLAPIEFFAPLLGRNRHKRTKEELARLRPTFAPLGIRSKAKHKPRKKAGSHNRKRSR